MDCYDNIHIALSLILALLVTGCTTTYEKTSVARTIESNMLQKVSENGSGSDLLLNKGDTIDITLKIESELLSVYVKHIKINVTEVDAKTISGEVIDVHGQLGRDPHTKYKDMTIMIKDIKSITVYSTQYYTKDMDANEITAVISSILGLILGILSF